VDLNKATIEVVWHAASRRLTRKRGACRTSRCSAAHSRTYADEFSIVERRAFASTPD
jgi:hypothetical protein